MRHQARSVLTRLRQSSYGTKVWAKWRTPMRSRKTTTKKTMAQHRPCRSMESLLRHSLSPGPCSATALARVLPVNGQQRERAHNRWPASLEHLLHAFRCHNLRHRSMFRPERLRARTRRLRAVGTRTSRPWPKAQHRPAQAPLASSHRALAILSRSQARLSLADGEPAMIKIDILHQLSLERHRGMARRPSMLMEWSA
jgi:hypothetical protein